MSDKIKNYVTVIAAGIVIFGLFFWSLFKPATQISESERRGLKQFPEISAETLINGKFMSSFEGYATDQFPLRDQFRSLKVFVAKSIFRQKDVNGIYQKDGIFSKIEYPLNDSSITNAASKLSYLVTLGENANDVKYYVSIVPDKNYFLADECKVPKLDYDKLANDFISQLPNAFYIPIFDLLSLEDYYKTDTHWRQECILDVADRLSETMGASISHDFETKLFRDNFYGVYAGQSAMNPDPEKLYYLTNSVLDNATVFDYETQSSIPVYDSKKGSGRDGYELFLSGSKSLLKYENSASESDRNLIIFRDSFGSSLAPLLFEGYKTVTIVDIRYISRLQIKNLIDLNNSDVLFLYSTLVLNNSITFK
ncbi:MAG: hypothetical protein MJ113_01740 [Lachnospiraceae bacterium]|nr:hypothetical protein [Lachnospiraceae bacterium]